MPHSQLKRQDEFNASTQKDACLPCSNSTETSRWMSEMERNPEVPTSTRDEAGFIPAAMCKESLGDPLNPKGDLTFLRRNERVPQVDTQLERNAKLPPITPHNPRNSPLHA
jgi:hypothetical protein